MSKKLIRGALIAGMCLSAAPVSAAVVVPSNTYAFNTGVAATSASGNGVGDTRTYTATNNAALTMKVSAWTLTPDTSRSYFNIFNIFNPYTVITPGTVKATTLAAYTVGLGDLGEGESVNNATHTIDNEINDDFLLLEFSEAVTLNSINLNVYAVDGSGKDSDALIAWGMTAGTVNPAGLDKNGLNALFAGSQESLGDGTNGVRSLGLSGRKGNLWMIGASQLNADGITDGFKLADLTVTTAVAPVPEPATWAMMLVGFGMIGAVARYRRRRTNVVFA